MVGIDPNDSTKVPSSYLGKVMYYIPLKSSASGTYGDTTVTPGTDPVCGDGIGTCADGGTGFGYNGADSLFMNLYFPLVGPEIVDAELKIHFDDLDLTPINDPKNSHYQFYESLSFSYWDTDKNGGAGGYEQLGGVIKDVSGLTGGAFAGGASTDPASPVDPFTWKLDLVDLALLDDLEASRIAHQGLWIQLGFGSNFCRSGENPDSVHPDHDVCTKYGKNTAEYLSATLHVSPVPLPSAVWLFGSALLGFIGMSRRTRV